MIEEALRRRGFENTRRDEPHEDYWTIEPLGGNGVGMLVERETGGWTVSRDPRGEEPRGQWVTIGRDMNGDEALAMVDVVSARLDTDEDAVIGIDLLSDDVEACVRFYEALRLPVGRRHCPVTGDSAVVDAGRLRMTIAPSTPFQPATTGTTVTIQVHDARARIRAALRELSPSEEASASAAVLLTDPDGRRVRLIDSGGGAPDRDGPSRRALGGKAVARL